MEIDRSSFMKIDLVKEAIEKLTKLCQELRESCGLKNLSDEYVMIQALKMYERQKERVLRNREVKNGK